MNDFIRTFALLILATLVLISIVTYVPLPVNSSDHQEGSI